MKFIPILSSHTDRIRFQSDKSTFNKIKLFTIQFNIKYPLITRWRIFNTRYSITKFRSPRQINKHPILLWYAWVSIQLYEKSGRNHGPTSAVIHFSRTIQQGRYWCITDSTLYFIFHKRHLISREVEFLFFLETKSLACLWMKIIREKPFIRFSHFSL